MKFKFSVSPNYNAKLDTKQIMMSVTLALIFISICSVILQYFMLGFEGGLRAALIIIVAVVTCYLTDLIFYKAKKLTKIQLKYQIEDNVPAITGMILALTLPLGDLATFNIFYVTIIAAILAELVGKILYGGFGFNIFNPAGVGRAFALLAFGKYLVAPTVDGLSNSTPLTALQSADGNMESVKETFGDFGSALFGVHGGSVGETIIIPLILACIYLIYRRAIDWVLPVTCVIGIVIFAGISTLISGYGWDFILIHLLSGGFVFGIVFMLTDPVTNPNSRQGKIIFAIIFTVLTFLIRFHANLPEGAVFALLICNMLVPLIDRYTANVTNKRTGMKVWSIVITLVVSILAVVVFNYI